MLSYEIPKKPMLTLFLISLINALIFLSVTFLNLNELESHLSNITNDNKALVIGKWIGISIGALSSITGPIFNLIIYSTIIWLLLLIITTEADFKKIFYTGIKAYIFLLIGNSIKGITNIVIKTDNINYFSLELLNVFFHNEILLNIFKSIDIFFIIFLSTWAYLIFKNSDERYKKPITIAYSGLLIILTSFNGIASYIATNL